MFAIGFDELCFSLNGSVLSPKINRINLWAESKMGLKQETEEGL